MYLVIIIIISFEEDVNSTVGKRKGTFTHARSGGGRRQAENWLQHKSLHAFTHTRSRSRGRVGAKSAPQQMGPTPNFPCLLRNRALQTNKWQIHPCPPCLCVNIPAVAERECQNPPISALQPPCAYVNIALGYISTCAEWLRGGPGTATAGGCRPRLYVSTTSDPQRDCRGSAVACNQHIPTTNTRWCSRHYGFGCHAPMVFSR